MSRLNKLTCLALVLLFSLALTAQPISFFDVLPDTGVVEAKLVTDINKCIRQKADETYQSGEFSFQTGPLSEKTYKISLRTRGNMRKQVCSIPPLKLKFSKSDLTFHKVKWVNSCGDTKGMESYLLQEYLVYKIHALITDYSYRARLLKVKYYSQDNLEKEIFARFAMILEPDKELAARFNGKPYNPKISSAKWLDQKQYALFILFEYLMGNTDWAIENQHNCTLITDRKTSTVVPIPYDFDYTGFVNTSYAIPNEHVPIKYVTQRYNRGHCMTESDFEWAQELLISKKSAIIELVENFSYLPEKVRARKISFLEDGFRDIENTKRSKRIFCRDCKEL